MTEISKYREGVELIYYKKAEIIVPKYELRLADLSKIDAAGLTITKRGLFCKKLPAYKKELENLVLELYFENPQYRTIVNKTGKKSEDKLEEDKSEFFKKPGLFSRLSHPFSIKQVIFIDNKTNWSKEQNKHQFIKILSHELWHVCESEYVKKAHCPLIREGTAVYASFRLLYKDTEFDFFNDVEDVDLFTEIQYVEPTKIVKEFMKDKNDLKLLFDPNVRMYLNDEVKKKVKEVLLTYEGITF